MQRGFSLVELSIVLVILGLLTGGILAGQSLIRAAELRSVSTEYQRYVAATQAFRDKYFAYPGDMGNATSFWGAAHATPATCLTTVGTGTQTCNGNANGQIDNPVAANQYGETAMYWQHLGNAGLIEGSYSGRSGAGAAVAETAGTNIPPSKLSGGGWGVNFVTGYGGSAAGFAGEYQNYLRIGAAQANSQYIDPLMKAEEAWNIDTKLDDGKPGLGKVVIRYWPVCTNAASQTDLNASYTLSNQNKDCTLFFPRAF